jgi:hypothetical protein
MEERYFSDDAAFEELEIAEDELIDQYVRGELSRPDTDQFEKTLAASPRLIQRVKNARVLAVRVRGANAATLAANVEQAREFQQKTSWWSNLFGPSTPRFAVAFSILLVLIGGVALLFAWLRLRQERTQLANQQATVEQLQRELDRQAAELQSQAGQSPRPTPTDVSTPPKQTSNQNSVELRPVLTFALFPGSTRSADGTPNDFRITLGTEQVAFELHLSDSAYTSYQPTISKVGGGTVFPPRSLKARKTASGAVVTVRIPANKLRPGDYLIDLKGRTSSGTMEPLEGYSFRILK